MYKLLLSLSFLLFVFGCSDSAEEEQEMEMNCSGTLTIDVDGQSVSYAQPQSAFLVENQLVGGSELGVLWSGNSGNVNFQLVIDLAGESCDPVGAYTLGSLPSSVSIFSLQYTSLSKQVSVSNVFETDGQSGWIEIISCDAENDIIDVRFEFTGTQPFGSDTPVVVTGGISEDICFSRMK